MLHVSFAGGMLREVRGGWDSELNPKSSSVLVSRFIAVRLVISFVVLLVVSFAVERCSGDDEG